MKKIFTFIFFALIGQGVCAQAIDTSVCLVVTSEKDVLFATGGKQLKTCNPKVIQPMITQEYGSVMLMQYTPDGKLLTTIMYGPTSRLRGDKIQVFTSQYKQVGNLIHETDRDGCIITSRIDENTPQYLTKQDVRASNNCADVIHQTVSISKGQPPGKYIKIKL